MTKAELLTQYKERYVSLQKLACKMEQYLIDIVKDYPRIDRVSARAKSPDSYLKKALKTKDDGELKYDEPIHQIQDQLGARIITYYVCDIKPICELVEDYFGPIESKKIQPESHDKFGYEGQHYILIWPVDVFINHIPKKHIPTAFELQIKTLFQHSWSETNHDLGYKPEEELDRDQLRKIAFTAAQAWGADQILNELFMECSKAK
ncbi:MAG TPA: hypothetical protein PKC29_09180 [Thermodesulfobacteriota bacterium]|nr:hypothetical protein [Thermodesulfobacteriota bacterium]